MSHDVMIIGGAFAGLSAAMQLARARRRVLVVDDGRPRNRFAAHSHGVLGLDGRPGTEILAEARAQLATYPTVEFRAVEAVSVERTAMGFTAGFADGGHATARRLILASGVEDVLPDLPGVRPRWGRTVLHCPYCHGYEIGGGAIGVLGLSEHHLHYAQLVADWGDVTLFLSPGVEPDAEQSARLARRGVRIERTPVVALEGEAPSLSGVRLADGRTTPLKALFVGSSIRQASGLALSLGCEMEDGPAGRTVRVDERKQTSQPGVFSAGDMARMAGNITLAAADGVMAAMGAHHSLIEEDGRPN